MKHITILLLCGSLILVSAGGPNTEETSVATNSNLSTETTTEIYTKTIDITAASKTANAQNVNENKSEQSKDNTIKNLGVPELNHKELDEVQKINEDPQKKQPDNTGNEHDTVSSSTPEAMPPQPVTTTTSSTTVASTTEPTTPTTTTKPTTPMTTTTSTTTMKPITSSTTTTTKTATPSTTTTPLPSTTPPLPSTTPPLPSSTTPAPKPIPPPSAGKWIVNGTNYTCIVVQMAAQINVTYMNVKHTKVFKVFNMPVNNVTSTGTCGESEQIMMLSWNSTESKNNTLTLHFTKDKPMKHYSLHHLEVSIAQNDLPQYNSSTPLVLIHNVSQFNTGVSNSYRCLKQQSLSLNGTKSVNGTFNETGVLTISDLQFQAFKTDKTMVFGLAEDCAFDTPDYVPIGVGCALAVLVIIVLIAYLIGRRRRQARGYLSM